MMAAMTKPRLVRRALLLPLALPATLVGGSRPAEALKGGGGTRMVWPDGGNDSDPRDPVCRSRRRSLAPDGVTDADPTDRPGRGRQPAGSTVKDRDPDDAVGGCYRPRQMVPKPSDADPRDP